MFSSNVWFFLSLASRRWLNALSLVAIRSVRDCFASIVLITSGWLVTYVGSITAFVFYARKSILGFAKKTTPVAGRKPLPNRRVQNGPKQTAGVSWRIAHWPCSADRGGFSSPWSVLRERSILWARDADYEQIQNGQRGIPVPMLTNSGLMPVRISMASGAICVANFGVMTWMLTQILAAVFTPYTHFRTLRYFKVRQQIVTILSIFAAHGFVCRLHN